jgi:hypothetical protein
LLYFVGCLTGCIAYRDKKVVGGVFVRFRVRHFSDAEREKQWPLETRQRILRDLA